MIGIFDIDNSTVSSLTREMLARAQKEGIVRNVSMEMPKSFILCEENGERLLYISQISTGTLLKRSRNARLIQTF